MRSRRDPTQTWAEHPSSTQKSPLLQGIWILPINVRSSTSAGVSCRSVLTKTQADSQRRGARLPVTCESFSGAIMLASATGEHRSKSASNTQAREQLTSNKEKLGRLLSLSSCYCSVDYWGSRLQSSLQNDSLQSQLGGWSWSAGSDARLFMDK